MLDAPLLVVLSTAEDGRKQWLDAGQALQGALLPGRKPSVRGFLHRAYDCGSVAGVKPIQIRQQIAASAERVYDALADQDNMGSWMGAKITIPTRGETGLVGTIRRVHLGPASFDERILEAERPSHIAYTIIGKLPALIHHRGELQIVSESDQLTNVDWRVELKFSNPLLGVIVKGVLSLVLTVALKRLARKLEAPTAAVA